MSISRRLQAHRQALASAQGEAAELATDPTELPGGNAEETIQTPSTTEEEQDMTDTTNAVAEAVAAERTRTNTVLASDNYAGREKLAASLLATELSAEQINIALAAAPLAVTAELIAVPGADTEAAARAEMQAAIAANQNSAIEPGAGGNASTPETEAAAAASNWSKAFAQANELAGFTA